MQPPTPSRPSRSTVGSLRFARWRLGITAVVVTALTLGALAAPAQADPGHATTYYVALGDSLAAGYQPIRPLDRAEGYVGQLYASLKERDRKLRLRNFGCDGATTSSLLSGGGACDYPGASSQLAAAERFLRAHKDKVRLVTIDIGANDINRCLNGGVIDVTCIGEALTAIEGNLKEIVRRLRAAAPDAQIVGMTYYNPYLAAWLNGPSGQELATQSRQLAAIFNAVLSAVYVAGGVRVADVAAAFASDDLDTQVPFPPIGTVPLGVARICQWTWMCSPEYGPDIHANKEGYAIVADAFRAALAT